MDPYSWFQWYFRYWLGRRSQIQINKWKNIVSSFRGKLVKMIKDASSKYDNYSISSLKLDTCFCIEVMN